jgi:hypothetical protein
MGELGLTPAGRGPSIRAMDDEVLDPSVDPPGDDEELDPREQARDRRRDRDAGALRRALMRPGMGKVFKQILDRQARDAEEPPERKKPSRRWSRPQR